tara:strand:- start:1216 stop:1509 length:294 start_codon:yes stop_codon:yes gene_type:complete
VISTIAISLLSILSLVLFYFCIKFAKIILEVQDTVEESLDMLDESYNRIDEILGRPLFFDSQEVRNVLKDIENSRDAIHKIAFSLTKNFEARETNEG